MWWVCRAAPYKFLEEDHGEKYPSMFPKTHETHAGSGLHKLATYAGWHQDYWKMSQVSQAFYCHCCQVGFSMTSQKCNGKTLPWKNGKNCSRPFSDGWLVGWKSLHHLKKSLMCSKYWSCLSDINFNLVPKWNADNGLHANEGKTESMLLIPPARA